MSIEQRKKNRFCDRFHSDFFELINCQKEYTLLHISIWRGRSCKINIISVFVGEISKDDYIEDNYRLIQQKQEPIATQLTELPSIPEISPFPVGKC